MSRSQGTVEAGAPLVGPETDSLPTRTKSLLSAIWQASVASALGAAALSALQTPFEALHTWTYGAALLFPFFLAFGAVSVLVSRLLSLDEWFEKVVSRVGEETVVRSLLLSSIAVGIVGAGGYISNVVFIDEPFSRLTLVGYATTVATALIVSTFGWWWLRRHALATFVEWRIMAIVTVLSAGVAVALLDALFLPALYHKLHLFLGGAAIVFLSIAALGAYGRWRNACTNAAIAICLLVVGASIAAYWAGVDPRIALLREPNAARRALAVVWQATDRDGDGYSPLLGGGDCNDNDPRAYPLSPSGHDCLGWYQLSSTPEPDASSESIPRSRAPAAPALVLLVTIDAFRCGFGESDRIELRNICPHLTKLARSGRFLGTGHTPHPDTRAAMNSIMRVQSRNWDPTAPLLPRVLAGLGYGSRAVVTHPRALAVEGLRESFDEVDTRLMSTAVSVGGITSDLLTERVIEHAMSALATRRPTFIWSHYYDPHAPYVETPGSPLASASLDGYVAEVRRTDNAIGALVSALETKAPAGDIVVIVTADHGEEFDEHRASRHGSNLYETTTRIPFVAWRTGTDARRGLPEQLPVNHDEVGHYISSVVTGAPFKTRGWSLLQSPNESDPQIALVHESWKLLYHRKFAFWELYDLTADAEERNDVAREHPERVRVLGAMLASEHARRSAH